MCCFDTFRPDGTLGQTCIHPFISKHFDKRTFNDTHRFLLGLLVLLLRLCLRDGSLASLRAVYSGLIAVGSGGSKVGTDDTTLVLHGAARVSLRGLLSETFLVYAAGYLGPRDLARVFALEEERLVLAVSETEDLGMARLTC